MSSNPETSLVEIRISKIASSKSVLIVFFLSISIFYSWSEKIGTALVSGFAITVPYLLTLVNLRLGKLSSKFARFDRFRSTIFEPTLVTILTYGLYLFISSRPIVTIQKSEILLAIGFLFVSLHALIGILFNGKQGEFEEVALQQ